MFKKVKEATGNTVEAASLLVRAEIDRFKLKLAKSLTRLISMVIAGFIVLLLTTIFLIFIGMSVSAALMEHFTPAISYLLVAGGYSLIAVLILIFKTQLFTNNILKKVLNELFDES